MKNLCRSKDNFTEAYASKMCATYFSTELTFSYLNLLAANVRRK